MSKCKIKISTNYKSQRKKFRPDTLRLVDIIVTKLAKGEILEPKHKDHQLSGDLKAFRECHVKPNLLLIYKKQNGVLTLCCLGSHNDLFKK